MRRKPNRSHVVNLSLNILDFWIGDWEAEWKSNNGEIKKGRNSIHAILGECVIFEEFDGRPGNTLVGKSLSVFDPRSGKWKQTWVDNSGGYLDFSGEFKDNKMTLSREIQTHDGKRIQRMVWYNISPVEFDWNWEISNDDGTTWWVVWQIYYTRL